MAITDSELMAIADGLGSAIRTYLDERLGPVVARLELAEKSLADRPGLRYQGIWRDGSYSCGDVITHRGGLWIAKAATTARPGESSDWQLAVKSGRDGAR